MLVSLLLLYKKLVLNLCEKYTGMSYSVVDNLSYV